MGIKLEGVREPRIGLLAGLSERDALMLVSGYAQLLINTPNLCAK